MDGPGTKRKLQENALTAKAESGTLKVKILRGPQDALRPRPKSRRQHAPPSPQSPPKPRPNRKHVPVFYQEAHQEQIRLHSHSSTGTQSTSTEGLGPNSTSSTSLVSQSFRDQLKTDVGPQNNPLFSRSDSDGVGSLGDLLKPYFPSPDSGANPRLPGLNVTTSSAGLLMDQSGPSAALHQLASSSASYRSALDALSSTAFGGSSSSSGVSNTSTSSTGVQSGGLETYKFDPLTALQSAIDQADRLAKMSKRPRDEGPKEIGSPNGNTRFYRLEPAGSNTPTETNGNGGVKACDGDANLGPPPELPPSFTLQNSLMGGGIHNILAVDEEDGKKSGERDSPRGDESDELGSPPGTAPALLLQNSLMGGGICLTTSPKLKPIFEKSVSSTSESSESVKGVHFSGICTAISASNNESDSKQAADNAKTSSEDFDLGPPPSGPPAFTIGNSLMGGGIELQPPATHVNTHNFDWKLHKSTSTSGDGANTNASSPGLRQRHGMKRIASTGAKEAS